MPTYVVMVIDADEDAWAGMSAEERQQTYDVDASFGARLAERGARIVGGQELDHSRRSRVLRRGAAADGGIASEGPFTESAEQIVGFYVVESPSAEVVLEAGELMLTAHEALEIRPVPTDEEDQS